MSLTWVRRMGDCDRAPLDGCPLDVPQVDPAVVNRVALQTDAHELPPRRDLLHKASLRRRPIRICRWSLALLLGVGGCVSAVGRCSSAVSVVTTYRDTPI